MNRFVVLFFYVTVAGVPVQPDHPGEQVHGPEQAVWHHVCCHRACQEQPPSVCLDISTTQPRQALALQCPAVLCQVSLPMLLVQPDHHRPYPLFLRHVPDRDSQPVPVKIPQECPLLQALQGNISSIW